ncbi:MAG: tetratricopeptide repeat protein [Bacteroidota bacterium]
MKKNLLSIVLIVLFIGAAGFIVIKYKSDKGNKKAMIYSLLERKGIQANSEEWKTIKTSVEKLQAAVKANPGDKKSLTALANYMIMEARASGNYSYYDAAAMKYIDEVLAIDPNNFEGLCLKALVELSQHHFSDGLATAEKVRTVNPYSAFVYGILTDANVELGNYDSAVAAADQMMSIRPDLRSYARVSYLREIYGDYTGAVEVMQAAVDAGNPGDEATEWSRVQLGQLYENMGNLKTASMQYNLAANNRPGYPYPLAGLARIAVANKEYDKALSFYLQADSAINDLAFKEDIADVYRMMGMNDKAADISNKALNEMEAKAKAAITDNTVGHYSDKEMAEAYIKNNSYDQAIEHALAEYNRRPNNIDVNETLAWAYFKKGENTKAQQYIQTALKTNSQNPRLLCRAGLIHLQAANKAEAKKYLVAGLKNNPNIFPALKSESETALKQL